MKSFAVAATLVSIVAANPGLLDSVLGDKTNLDAGVKLPAGISVDLSLGPKYPPPSGRTNTWHPAHPGVDMDGCDAGDDDWHYVHPCHECQGGHHTWATSTGTRVVTKTVIDCPETVTDCPARTTAVTTVTTTICPETVTGTATATGTTTTIPVPVVTETSAPVVTETPCPETTTQAPPATFTTSPCPETTVAPPAPNMPTQSMPQVGNNNTMTQPPVIVNAGAQAQVGIFAAIAAVVALL